jgi:aminoglycoside phosphotransferase (APT) family kinase protein
VNPYRSVPLAARTTVFRERLATLGAIARSEGRTLDIDSIDREWRRAERQPRDLGVRWIHADLHGSNVLSRGGRLAAILDWGDAAGGDPARDLGQVWLLLAIEDIPLAFDAYGGISEATEIRCRGEALYSAVTLGILDEPTQAHAAWATLVTMGVAERT